MNEKNELLKILLKDEEWVLLTDILDVLESSKIWDGKEYTYNPIPPSKYKPLIESISNRLDVIEKKYGIGQ